MFKRIIKIVGLVLLAFTVGVGLIVGYMALTGQFKKKVVKPTSVSFSIADVEPEILDDETGELIYPLVYDVNGTEEEKIFSLIVGAEPADVTVRDCTITVNAQSSRLITFKHKVGEEWQDYKSNAFKLNQRVYFTVNEISEDNQADYIDGVITMTVTDKSGLLQSQINLSIDRKVSSVSIRDLYNNENNKVLGGKFKYETSANNNVLTLSADVGENYPLEIISAPLKALAPIKAKGQKTSEIYFIENNQYKLLVHSGDGKVSLEYASDSGELISEPCDFLLYDQVKNIFVLNSKISNEYNFRISTYKTYAQELELKDKEYSARVADMISKDFRISVTGNDATDVKFESEDGSLLLGLFETSSYVVNNIDFESLGVNDNLGLKLYKNIPYTEITDRYNEIEFINDEHLLIGGEWNFNYYSGADEIHFNTANLRFETANGLNKVRLLNALQGIDKVIKADTMFDAELVADGEGKYKLTLTNKEYEIIFTELHADGKFVKFIDTNSTKTVMTIRRNSLTIPEGSTEKVYKLNKNAFTSVMKTGEVVWLDNVYYNEQYQLILNESEFNNIPLNSYIYKLQDAALELIEVADNKTLKYMANAYYTKDSQGNYALVTSQKDFNINTKYYVLKQSMFEETTSTKDNASYILTKVVDSAEQYVYELWTTQQYQFNTRFGFGDRLVVTSSKVEDGKTIYEYKSIDRGIYLIFLNETDDKNLNDRFSTKIEYNSTNPNNSIISVTPIDPTLIDCTIKLYALVINSDGSYYYSDELQGSLYVSVTKTIPQVKISNSNLYLEGNVSSGDVAISYTNVNVEDLVTVTNASGVSLEEYGVLMLAPKVRYELLTMATEPDNWGEIYTNYYKLEYVVPEDDDEYVYGKYFKLVQNEGQPDKYEIANEDDWTNVTCYKLQFNKLDGDKPAYSNNTYYYAVNNNYLFEDNVSHWHNGIEYVLLGKTDVNGAFVNQIIPTGINYNSLLYPVVPSVKYLVDKNRVQTPSEYISELIKSGENLSIENVFETDKHNRRVTANTYYKFSDSAVSVEFGGTYFDEGYGEINKKTIAGGQYDMIIVNHNSIDKNIKGTTEDTATETQVSSLVAELVFELNNTNSLVVNQVLNNIVNELTVRVYKYNTNGVLVQEYNDTNSPIKVNDIKLEYNYIKATGDYNNKTVYYNEDKSLATPSDEDIADWINKRDNYYIRVATNKLSVVFTAQQTIDENESVVLAFDYKGYVFKSNQLYIRSQDVGKYELIPSSKVDCIATPVDTSEGPTDGKTYYKLDGNNFVTATLVDNKFNTAVKYYTLITKPSELTICYLIEVDYDGEYKYNVTYVDNNGNYLVTSTIIGEGADAEIKYELISTNLQDAFTVGKGINYAPFYANNYMSYTFSSNPYINFITNTGDNKNVYPYNISVLEITDGFVVITLTNSFIGTITLPISVKIVASDNFKFTEGNNIYPDVKKKTTSLSNLQYIYKDTAVDLTADLIPTLTSVTKDSVSKDFELDNSNSDISNKKWVYKNKSDANETIAITYELGWKVTRSDYDNYELIISFKGINDSKNVTVKFEKPYDRIKSSTNATKNVYEGTNFVLADVITATDVNNTNILFHSMTDNLKIYFINSDDTIGDEISDATNKGYIIWEDIAVNGRAEQKFGIYYADTQIDTFTLTILPNAFITNYTDTIIELDDENKLSDVMDIEVKKYGTDINYIEYDRYQETESFTLGTTYKYENGEYKLASSVEDKGDDNKLYIDAWEGVEVDYESSTYTDDEFKNLYNVNITTITDNTITVNKPITEIGTYYVKVDIKSKSGSSVIGNLKYRVDAKTDISVEDIVFEAKENYEANIGDEIKAVINNQYFNKAGAEATYIENGYYYLDNAEYKLIGNADLFTTQKGKNNIYTKVDLTGVVKDIFWINSSNKDLTITYTYGDSDTVYSQCWEENTLTPIIKYKPSGSDSERTYHKVTTSVLIDATGYYIVGKTNKDEKDIKVKIEQYMIPSVYVFEDRNNATNGILILFVNNYGKQIKVTSLPEVTAVKQYIELTGATNLTEKELSIIFNYNNFGSSLDDNAEYVAQIASTAEVVVELDSKYYNIKSSKQFNINVTPFKPELSNSDKQLTIGADGTTITLHDGNENSGIFKKDSNNTIKSISIESEDVVVTKTVSESDYKYEAMIKPVGNTSYVTIVITLTYSDNTIYKYTEILTIVNTDKVVVKTPYNTSIDGFEASVDNLVRDINNQSYDTTDLKVWLNGVIDANQLPTNPISTMKFDLALVGDSINLINDTALGIQRFNVGEYDANTNETYEPNKYYSYDSNTDKYTLLIEEPTDWDESDGYKNYYVFTQTQTDNVGRIELEAVSIGLSQHLTNLTNNNWLIISGNTINITRNFKGSTGYLLFKVYQTELETSPYGYYLVKVVNDINFSGVNNTRGVGKITLNSTEHSSQGILELIKSSSIQISSFGVSPSHVIDNNVYLFMIESHNNVDNSLMFKNDSNEDIKINPTDLIKHNQKMPFGINTGFVKVAVVLKIGDSFAWIGNYQFVLESTIEVTPTGNVNETPEDSENYVYKVKDNLEFDFTNTGNNTKDLNAYLTVNNGTLYSACFINSMNITEGFVINDTDTSLYYDANSNNAYDNGTDIKVAEIIVTGTDTKLSLVKATSIDYEFYVKLTYNIAGETNKFVAYLHFGVDKYQTNATTEYNIGEYSGSGFNTSIALSNILGGNYSYTELGEDKDLEIKYNYNNEGYKNITSANTDKVYLDATNKKLVFTQTTTQAGCEITITINNVVPSITKDIAVNIQPSISSNFNSEQGKASDNPIKTEKQTSLTATGSSLFVTIDKTNNKIEIKSKETDGTIYYTINANNIDSVDFNLYDIADTTNSTKINNYFVDNFSSRDEEYSSKTEVEKENYRKATAKNLPSSDNYLNFVHMVSDKTFKLVVTVKTSSASYENITIYIKLEKTYELTPQYRVEGAEYEVAISGTSLGYNGGDIESYLFGIGGGIYGTHTSRFMIKHGDEEPIVDNDTFNNLGLFEDGNPNKLKFELNAEDVSGVIDPYSDNKITFNAGDSGDAWGTLVIANNNGLSMDYLFRVQSVDNDFNIVTLNSGLLISENGGKKYISITSNQFNDQGLILATLKYSNINENNPNTLNQPIYILGGSLELLTIDNTIVLKKTTDVNNSITNGSFDIIIITLNGEVTEFTLVISDFVVEKTGYDEGENSETLFAGRTYYIVPDSEGDPRINVSTKGSPLSLTKDNLLYRGALNGVYNEYYGSRYDYAKDDIGLIEWNSDDLSFEVKAVSSNRTVTLVFDVLDSGNVIGRICYVINIYNHINISMNGTTATDKSVELYLGSPMYFVDEDTNGKAEKFDIDLMDKQNGSNYNNAFVILQHYLGWNEDGSIITRTIFDGSNSNNVAQHLRFEAEGFGDLKGRVSVNEKTGVITINANKSGTINLIITSIGAPQYRETFVLNVHKYENVKVVHTSNNPGTDNNGNPLKSGAEFDLYTLNEDSSKNYAFEITRTECSYNETKKEFTFTKENYSSASTIEFKYIVSKDVKTEAELNSITSGWSNAIDESARLPQVPYGETYYVIIRLEVTICVNDSNFYYAYYKVQNDVRLSVNEMYGPAGQNTVVTYGSDAWNGDKLLLMDFNNQGLYSAVTVINNSDGDDWYKASDSSGLVNSAYNLVYSKVTSGSVDELNEGLYFEYKNGKYSVAPIGTTATTYTKHYVSVKSGDDYYVPVLSGEAFDDTTYDYYECTSTGYSTEALTEAPTDFNYPGRYFKKIAKDDYKEYHQKYKDNGYYQRHNIFNKLVNDASSCIDLANMYVELYNADDIKNGVASPRKAVATVSDGRLSLSLAEGVTPLFENEADIIIRFIDKNGSTLFEDTWHFKSQSNITAKSSKSLTDFFLTSEVPDSLLGTDIIALSTDTNIIRDLSNFVEGGMPCKSDGSTISDTSDLTMLGYWIKDNNKYKFVKSGTVSGDEWIYKLYEVKYKGTDSSVIHENSRTFNVLSGNTNYNALMYVTFNAGDYINIIVDDDFIAGGYQTDLADYIKLYKGQFVDTLATNISVSQISDTDLTVDGSIIKVDEEWIKTNSDKTSIRRYVSISGGTSYKTTRYIPVEFNFIISANNDDNTIYDSTNGEFKHNSTIANLVNDTVTSKTFEFSDTSENKIMLLSWIKFDGANIISDDYNKFNVKVELITSGVNVGKYNITYTYSYDSVSYARTFVMSASA